MGKLLITNHGLWNETLRACFKTAGFRENAYENIGDTSLTVYRKLKVNNMNFHSGANRDFAACAGTLFYKERFGEEALEQLLEDAKTMDVQQLRRNLMGSYVVAVKTGDVLRVFVDETHTYHIYYYYDGQSFLITNTYHHIEKCVQQPMHENAFLERGVREGILSAQSPYENIFRLETSYIEINLKNGIFALKTCALNDYSVQFTSKEEALQCIWDRSQKIAQLRSQYIKNHLLFLTGGLDSRMELAINLYNQDHVKLGYWMGSDVITNGTTEDKACGQEIAHAFGLEYECYDVSESFSDALNGINSQKCDKYGEYACKCIGNSRWLSIFESLEGIDFLGFGFAGETLRPLGQLDQHYQSPYFISNFIKDIYCRNNIEKNVYSSNTQKALYGFIECEACEILNCKKDHELTEDDCFRLFTYSRLSADCVMNNLSNLFTYAFPLLMMKPVAEAINSVPYSWRKNNWFSISLTNMWGPELLKIPYFSHHHTMLYDANSMMVTETKGICLRETIKPFLMKSKLYDWLYLGFFQKYVQPRKKQDAAIFELCIQTLEDSPAMKLSKLQLNKQATRKNLSVDSFATFVAMVKVADCLLAEHQKR